MPSHPTLYVITGSSSDAVTALGAHLGIKLNIRERRDHVDDLSAVNPARTVPTLIDENGLILTETSAILNHLARNNAPELLGHGKSERAKNEELLSRLASSVTHAFLLHFRPDKSADSDAAKAAVKEKASGAIDAALDQLENQTPDKGFAIGPHLATSDFLFFVLLNWAERIDPMMLSSRPRLSDYFTRLKSLPFHAKTLASDAA